MTGDLILAGGFNMSPDAGRYLAGMVITPMVLFGMLALSAVLVIANSVFFLPLESRLAYVRDAFVPWRFFTNIHSQAGLWIHAVVMLIKLLGLIALTLYAFVYGPFILLMMLRAR